MSKLIEILGQDITNLLTGADDYDLQIIAGEGPTSKTFEAHSVILRARSPYFKTALSSTWAKKHGEKMVFTKPNISPAVFGDILRYVSLYSTIFCCLYSKKGFSSPLIVN